MEFHQKTNETKQNIFIKSMKDESGNVTENQTEIASIVNKVFASLGLYKGPVKMCTFPDNLNIPEFNFRPITRRELYEVIDNLDKNKSSGPRNIPAWAIKEGKMAIGVHLQFTINECIKTNVFPSELKKAYVTPIYKKGDKQKGENYRPISVTPMFAKIFERLLLNQLSEYTEKHKIINQKQFGFQREKSCIDAVLLVVEKIVETLDNNEHCVSIFLDLAKAFNSICHEILLRKLESYCFSNNSISLLQSFLSDRKQSVKLNSVYSSWETLNHGVPQGTVLGPFIFLLYVNDFAQNITSSNNIVQFADDTSVLCIDQNPNSLQPQIKQILAETEDYLEKNKMTLNRDKTELLYFSKEKQEFSDLEFRGEKIKPLSDCRYLGIQIDKYLNFKKQLNKCLSKMACGIRSIYLIRHQIPLYARIMLFKSLVLSHLTYAGIFFQNLNEKDISRLNKQINWGIKVCYMRRKFDRARDLLIKSKILPAELYITQISLMKFWTDINRTKNNTIHGLFNIQRNERTKKIKTYKSKTKLGDKSLIKKSIQKWNKLSLDIKTTKTSHSFRKKLKEFLHKSHNAIPLKHKIGAFKKYFYV